MRASRTLLIALLVAAVPAGWWFGSPWWTLGRMRAAAVAGDAEALSAFIDYPALRASTHEQICRRVGPLLCSALPRRAVDVLISPEALRLGLMDPREPSTPADLDMVRKGLNEFRIRRKGPIGIGNELVFRRHGLAWRVEAINLDPTQ